MILLVLIIKKKSGSYDISFLTKGTQRMRNVPKVAPAIAPTAPITENIELENWLIVWDKSSSTTVMSEEKRFKTRPAMKSKKKRVKKYNYKSNVTAKNKTSE